MELWVTVVEMVGSTVLTPSVVLTTVPAMLLVLVVARGFCIGLTITRIILSGFHPQSRSFQGRLSGVGVFMRENGLREFSRCE